MLIESNLKLCRVPEEQWDIYCAEANEFLKQTDSRWDIIYFDPPYKDDYLKTLELVGSHLRDLLIVEHHHKNKLPESIAQLHRTRILKQGDSALSFFKPQINAERGSEYK
jgi:16S rRNA G966 N2-methylase RsmD